jgi:hypothetical protein
MHGRNLIRLLAGLFFLTALLMGQSERSETSSPSQVDRSASATKSAAVNGAAVNDRDASAAVVPVRSFPIASGSPLPSVPIPQPLPRQPPGFPVPPGVMHLTRAAGMIFSGTVTKVERISNNTPGEAVGTVSITFHVEEAMRGVRAGEFVTISQWIGLWWNGQRYRIGERVLLFLYPRSRIGLTSCVGASTGRFAVDSAGVVWFSGQQMAAFRTDPVLGGRSRVRLSDFAWAVRRASEGE